MEYNIKLTSEYKKDDILKIKNTNNDKYLNLKILNVNFEFSIEKNGIMSTNDLINYAPVQGTNNLLSYRTHYTCISLDDSFYNTENIKQLEKGKIFYMDEKFLINKGI